VVAPLTVADEPLFCLRREMEYYRNQSTQLRDKQTKMWYLFVYNDEQPERSILMNKIFCLAKQIFLTSS
jgi:hypothetical protein